jgi:hypothetical protein
MLTKWLTNVKQKTQRLELKNEPSIEIFESVRISVMRFGC